MHSTDIPRSQQQISAAEYHDNDDVIYETSAPLIRNHLEQQQRAPPNQEVTIKKLSRRIKWYNLILGVGLAVIIWLVVIIGNMPSSPDSFSGGVQQEEGGTVISGGSNGWGDTVDLQEQVHGEQHLADTVGRPPPKSRPAPSMGAEDTFRGHDVAGDDGGSSRGRVGIGHGLPPPRYPQHKPKKYNPYVKIVPPPPAEVDDRKQGNAAFDDYGRGGSPDDRGDRLGDQYGRGRDDKDNVYGGLQHSGSDRLIPNRDEDEMYNRVDTHENPDRAYMKDEPLRDEHNDYDRDGKASSEESRPYDRAGAFRNEEKPYNEIAPFRDDDSTYDRNGPSENGDNQNYASESLESGPYGTDEVQNRDEAVEKTDEIYDKDTTSEREGQIFNEDRPPGPSVSQKSTDILEEAVADWQKDQETTDTSGGDTVDHDVQVLLTGETEDKTPIADNTKDESIVDKVKIAPPKQKVDVSALISGILNDQRQAAGDTKPDEKGSEKNTGISNLLPLVHPVSRPREPPARPCSQPERLTRVLQQCAEQGSLLTAVTDVPDNRLRDFVKEMYVDEVNQVVFCSHAGAGLNIWSHILLNRTYDPGEELDVKTTIARQGDFPRLNSNDYSLYQIRYRLRAYFKLMVVRHPLDRIASFYKKKFVNSDSYRKHLGKVILQTYHSEWGVNDGLPSFADVIRWINDGHRDEHWSTPYSDHCHPCTVRYDYISKMETHAQDYAFIKEHVLKTEYDLGMSELGDVDQLANGGRRIDLYSYVPLAQTELLLERVKEDMEFYDYHYEKNSLVATCGARDTCC